MDMPDSIFGMDVGLIKVFAIPVLVGVGLLVTVGAVIVPKVGEIQDYNSKTAKLVKTRKDVEARKNYLLNINQDEILKNSEYLNMALLKNKDAYVLVTVIRSVVEKFGYSVDSFSISPGTVGGEEVPASGASKTTSKTKKTKVAGEQNDLARIPVTLTLLGPKDKFMDLITEMESSLPILSIGKMDIKNEGQLSTIKMSISSYFSTEKTDVKIASVSIADLTLSQKENELIESISKYSKIEGVNASDTGLIRKKDFTKYDRPNPFTL